MVSTMVRRGLSEHRNLKHHLHLAPQLVHRDAMRLVDRIAIEHDAAEIGL